MDAGLEVEVAPDDGAIRLTLTGNTSDGQQLRRVVRGVQGTIARTRWNERLRGYEVVY